MIRLGLVGYPLEHSLSPKIHAAALRACGLKGEYRLFPIHPADTDDLRALLNHFRVGLLQGLNVTIPHKQTVIPMLDALTPTAQAIGAVNTIFYASGQLTGDNTDAPGFWTALQRLEIRPAARSALVLGAGGSARAVTYALRAHGWDVTITARRPEQAQELARQFGTHSLTFDTLHTPAYDLIVNTTPLGMTPEVDASPWPAALPLPPQAAVYDLVYNPVQTQFVRAARRAGLSAISGAGMLIEQAALAFERWTGCSPDRAPLFQTLEAL